MTSANPKSKSQTRQVFDRLRSDIIAGRLLPDAKLNIAALADSIAVSAGAVREGLAMLEAESLVVSEPARGYRVSPVSIVDLQDLVNARIEVEKLCLAEAIRHGGLQWEGAVVAAHHQLSRLGERDDADPGYVNPAWAAAHGEFHRALISGCPNSWLRRLHETLYLQSERYRQLSAPLNVGKRNVAREHKAMLDAVLTHDIVTAQALMAEHLHATARLLLSSPRLAVQAV